MGEHCLDFISINCRVNDNCSHEDCIHFITHLSRRNKTHTKVIPDAVSLVYTSQFNVWYMKTFLGISTERLVGIESEKETYLEFKGEKFSFIFIDSNHCPGSVMVLLKGNFGQCLYTGYCRYAPSLLNTPSLANIINSSSPSLDRLYIDGTYYYESINFPSRDEALRDSIQLIDAHRRERVYICTRLLGLEKALREISLQLNENIVVSKEKYRILKKLGWASHFSCNPKDGRIHIVPYKEVTLSKMLKRRRSVGPCIAIVMSAVFLLWKQEKVNKYRNFGIYLIPYSDHSSSVETKIMVRELKPKKTFYLNKYPLLVNDLKCKNVSNLNKVLEVINLENEFVASHDVQLEKGASSLNLDKCSQTNETVCNKLTLNSQFDLWDLTGNFLDDCQGILN